MFWYDFYAANFLNFRDRKKFDLNKLLRITYTFRISVDISKNLYGFWNIF